MKRIKRWHIYSVERSITPSLQNTHYMGWWHFDVNWNTWHVSTLWHAQCDMTHPKLQCNENYCIYLNSIPILIVVLVEVLLCSVTQHSLWNTSLRLPFQDISSYHSEDRALSTEYLASWLKTKWHLFFCTWFSLYLQQCTCKKQINTVMQRGHIAHCLAYSYGSQMLNMTSLRISNLFSNRPAININSICLEGLVMVWIQVH